MIILGSTTDKLQLITSSTADIHCIASYADMDDTTKAVLVDRQLTAITSATTTDILAAPGAGASRNLKGLHVTNAHASASNDITLNYNANGTLYQLEKVTLAFGEHLRYDGDTIRVYDSSGREKLPTGLVPPGAAITAQIASHSADTYYVGFDVTNRIKAGSYIIWNVKGLSKGAAGIAAPIFTVRFGTAAAVGDTSRAAITLGAQTAAADTGEFDVIATFRAVGASAVIRADVGLRHNLQVTGFATTPAGYATGGATSGTFDSTVASSKIGLSVNPGAAGAWVVESCIVVAGNLAA